jgi:hypothetical protein
MQKAWAHLRSEALRVTGRGETDGERDVAILTRYVLGGVEMED